MKKIFVLDTNVLLHDPRALFGFDDNMVVIPIYVIEEIDSFKKDLSELGRNARQIARALDDLRLEGSLSEGVTTASGGTIKVAITTRALPAEYYTSHQTDNKILATALHFHEQCRTGDDFTTIFVTKDVNLRIRADALGLTVEDYDAERTDISELYSGVMELEVGGDAIDTFYRTGSMPLDDPYYFPNQFAFLKDAANPAHSAMGKMNLDTQAVEPLLKLKDGMWGIRPRNREQSFAADVLMNDAIKLVTLVGKAGTGKTLLAIAA
ncbi:MAG: PhoH family protein, partial [Cytophagaceae bacterium]